MGLVLVQHEFGGLVHALAREAEGAGELEPAAVHVQACGDGVAHDAPVPARARQLFEPFQVLAQGPSASGSPAQRGEVQLQATGPLADGRGGVDARLVGQVQEREKALRRQF